MTKSIKLELEVQEHPQQSIVLIAALGFSFFWASFFILLFQPLDFIGASGEALPYPYMRIACLLGLGAASFIMNLKADFFATIKGRHILEGVIVGYPVIALAVLYMHLYSESFIPAMVYVVVWMLLGAGLACLRMIWIEMLSNFSQGQLSDMLCFSVVIGALLYVTISNLALPLMVAAFCALPYLGWGLFRILDHEVSPLAFVSRKESVERMPLLKTTDLFITLYGIVFGLAISYISDIPQPDFLTIGIGIALALGAAAMIPALKRNTGKMIHGKTQQLLFPLLVVGLVPLPFVDGFLYYLCALLLIGCFIAFTITNLEAQIAAATHYSCSPIYLVGKGGTPIIVGVTLGYALGYFFTASLVANSLFLYYIPLCLVVLLTLCITFIPFERDRFADDLEQDAPSHEKAGRWKQRCEIAAEKGGLSMREKEVFTLLAKGRGAEYIQSKLYISTHTVKSHSYNIYRKLGVSSREELITIVEETEIPDDEHASAR